MCEQGYRWYIGVLCVQNILYTGMPMYRGKAILCLSQVGVGVVKASRIVSPKDTRQPHTLLAVG